MTTKLINLNVGGHRFTTSLSTLTSDPNSMLARMFSDDWNAADGNEKFIDRDGLHFRYILNYLRDGVKAYIPQDQHIVEELLIEANFYQLNGLIPKLTSLRSTKSNLTIGSVVTLRPEAAEAYFQFYLSSGLAKPGIVILCGNPYYENWAEEGVPKNVKMFLVSCVVCGIEDSVALRTISHGDPEAIMQKAHLKYNEFTVDQFCGKTCIIITFGEIKFHVPMTAICLT